MTGLEDLAGVPNVSTVIERIDNAATKSSMLFRSIGMCLHRGKLATQDDIDDMIRELALAATEEAWNAQERSKTSFDGRMTVDEVSGVVENDFFRVVVKADHTGALDIEILLRLV
jgi:hypothetical protein